jgi:hypothetical protein
MHLDVKLVGPLLLHFQCPGGLNFRAGGQDNVLPYLDVDTKAFRGGEVIAGRVENAVGVRVNGRPGQEPGSEEGHGEGTGESGRAEAMTGVQAWSFHFYGWPVMVGRAEVHGVFNAPRC